MVDLPVDQFASARQQMHGKKRLPKPRDTTVKQRSEKEQKNQSAQLAEALAGTHCLFQGHREASISR
jgi:hypothetical protein